MRRRSTNWNAETKLRRNFNTAELPIVNRIVNIISAPDTASLRKKTAFTPTRVYEEPYGPFRKSWRTLLINCWNTLDTMLEKYLKIVGQKCQKCGYR